MEVRPEVLHGALSLEVPAVALVSGDHHLKRDLHLASLRKRRRGSRWGRRGLRAAQEGQSGNHNTRATRSGPSHGLDAKGSR